MILVEKEREGERGKWCYHPPKSSSFCLLVIIHLHLVKVVCYGQKELVI